MFVLMVLLMSIAQFYYAMTVSFVSFGFFIKTSLLLYIRRVVPVRMSILLVHQMVYSISYELTRKQHM